MEKHRENISNFGVKEIGLFGSYLGGKQRGDVDLVIKDAVKGIPGQSVPQNIDVLTTHPIKCTLNEFF